MGFLNALADPFQAMMQGASPGFAGGMFGGGANPNGSMSLDGIGAGTESALARNAAQPRQPQKPKMGVADFIGMLADGVRGYRGQEPMYGPAMEKRRLAETRKSALSNFLTDPKSAVQELLAGGDFEGGLALWKATQKDDDTPAAIREFREYQKLPNDQRGNYERYLQLTHPGMMAPITMGAGDTLEMPGQGGGEAPSGETTATGPNGEKIRFNPQSNTWEPIGGAPAGPAPTFPR